MTEPTIGFNPDVIILGVEFSDDYELMTFRYVEARDVAPKAWRQSTVTLERSLLPAEEFSDVMESLQSFMDVGLRHVRTDGGNTP